VIFLAEAKKKEAPKGYIVLDGTFTALNKEKTVVAVKRGSANDSDDPLVALETSYNNMPCLCPLENPFREDRKIFALELTERKGCSTFGHDLTTSFQIDSQPEGDTYVINKFNTSQVYLDFLKKNGDQMKFIGRRKIRFRDTALCQQLDLRNLDNIDAHLDIIEKYMKLLGFVFFGFLALGVVCEICLLFSTERNTHVAIGTLTAILVFLSCITILFNYLFVKERIDKINDSFNKTLPKCRPDGAWGAALDESFGEIQKLINAISDMTKLMFYAGVGAFLGAVIFTFLVCSVKGGDGSQVDHVQLVELSQSGAAGGAGQGAQPKVDPNDQWLHDDSLNIY
jgi:hypothetical protein